MVINFNVRSITMRETLAFARRAFKYLRILLSSNNLSP